MIKRSFSLLPLVAEEAWPEEEEVPTVVRDSVQPYPVAGILLLTSSLAEFDGLVVVEVAWSGPLSLLSYKANRPLGEDD